MNDQGYSALWQLVMSRWRMFYREPSALFWTFGFPIVLALALGVAFRNRPPQPIDAAVLSGPGAEALRAQLDSKTIHVHIVDDEAAAAALRTGKVAVVVVPGTPRAYRYDPTRPDSRIARAIVDDRLQRAEGRTDPTPVVDREVTEPGSRYIDFLIPGLLGFGLMSSGLWGVGFVIVEMRQRKLLKRMLATPMRKSSFLFSFVLMRGLFLIAELPILLIFARTVFDVPVRGSWALLFALATLGSLVFAGLGLLVASRAQNQQTVGGLINLVTMPMAIGSGVFFSAQRFPDVLQPVLSILPLTALNDATRAIMLEGAGLAQVARPTLILLAWGALAFLAALTLFRWR